VTAVPTGIALLVEWQAQLDRPVVTAEEGLRLVVPPGRPLRDVARELGARGTLANPDLITWATHLTGQARRIQAGEYQFRAGTTLRELLHDLLTGRVLQHSVTIVEGWRYTQLLDALRAHPTVVGTLQGLTDEEVMARIGAPGLHPEGRFLPETYFFPRGTTDVEILQRAFRQMASRLAEAWELRAPGLPIDRPEQALVLASIVEKETGDRAERPRVAGVLVRRLQRGMPLQVDATVIYGLGARFDGDLRRADLAADTPYNTYVRRGLPPTPIALPGVEAIRAAVQPERGNALYFVARGDGTHQFSDSLEEHNRAVARYQLRGARGRSADDERARTEGTAPDPRP
jgi:UPF0755 protein